MRFPERRAEWIALFIVATLAIGAVFLERDAWDISTDGRSGVAAGAYLVGSVIGLAALAFVSGAVLTVPIGVVVWLVRRVRRGRMASG